jgi:membrane protease YdiL (CAAX protease family)
VASQNYYQILQLPVDATQDQIESAYRELAKQCHPDGPFGNAAKEERLKLLDEAYEALRDQDRRAAYDLEIQRADMGSATPASRLAQIRAHWPRTLLQVGVFIVFAIVAMNVLALVALFIPNLFLASAISVFLGSLLATALAMRIFFHQPVVAVGLHWNQPASRNLAAGLLMGILAGSIATLLPVATGIVRWEPTVEPFSVSALIVFLVLILFSAIGEEVLFRGFPMQRLQETFGPAPAVLVTSLIFGWAHAGNLSVTWVALLNTFLWGVVFGCAWLKTRDLWLPIGLHVGWNWTLPLLGVQLSGFTLEVTGYRLVGGGTLWDGGAYGPEAGLVTTLLVPAMLFVIWRAPIRRSA